MPAFADHSMGFDITYECIGPCTYRIYHTQYYDCAAPSVQSSLPVSTTAPTGIVASPFGLSFTGIGSTTCNQPVQITAWSNVKWDEVTPICPDLLTGPSNQHPTHCDGTNPNPQLNGVAAAVYFADYDFCNTNCDSYTIEWGTCCRNGDITTGAAYNPISAIGTTINKALSPCNSSPYFTQEPVPYICAGNPFTFNQGAVDPDGDSLSYELGPCYASSSGAQVNYGAGYSPTQPMGPTWDVQLNPLTGDITFTPNPTGAIEVGVVCVLVHEWRNGQLIGTITRDMQVTVIDLQCGSGNPTTSGVTNLRYGPDEVPGNPIGFSTVRACPGSEVCFDISLPANNPNLTYTISWNQAIPNATFVSANNPTIVNSISGSNPVATFCWTPPINGFGIYQFVVTTVDDRCPIPGLNQMTYTIMVEDPLAATSAIAVPISCNDMELSVVPASTMPSIYNHVFTSINWSGNGNLSYNPNLTDSSFIHTYPAPGGYFFQVEIEDTLGCSTRLTGIANLTTGAIADAGSDATICSNYDVNLGAPAIPGQTYTWTPGTYLNSTTAADPLFDLPTPIPPSTSFSYMVEVVAGVCTTFDYVDIFVNPTIEATATAADPVICTGANTNLTATTNLGGGLDYLWSTGATTPTIQVTPTQTTTYSVIAFANGCASDPAYVTVQVNPGPTPTYTGSIEVCEGGNTILNAFGGDHYLWQPMGYLGSSMALTNLNASTTISLLAVDADGCQGTAVPIDITVHPNPLPGFTATDICEDSLLQFTDAAQITEGSIAGWIWDFGDGAPVDILQNPQHTFTQYGQYTVTQTAISAIGCEASISFPVNVHPNPTADFAFTNVCEGLPNLMNNTSTIPLGTSITQFEWAFGDGTGDLSNVPNTQHTYAQYGYYDVTLSVASPQGCGASYTQTVFVHPNPVADFEVENACQDSVVLVSTGSAVGGDLDYISQYNWDFGDPFSGTDNFAVTPQSSHAYDVFGPYQITHTITTANGCSDQIQRELTVFAKPTANFSYDQTCENEHTQFQNLSNSNDATLLDEYAWDFGDGNEASGPQTSHLFLVSGPGTYPVQLAIITEEGCTDTLIQQVVINPAPLPNFRWDPVCLHDSMKFVDLTALASGSMLRWEYDFGDGIGTSSLANPSYQFLEPGIFPVELTAISDSGCFNRFTTEVETYKLPEIREIITDSACFGYSATLAAIPDEEVNLTWYHQLDDQVPFHRGYTYTTPPLPYPTTYYLQARSAEGCENERVPITAHVYEGQDVAIVAHTDRVDLPLAVVNFEVASTIDLTSFEWRFGDGETSDLESPSHAFGRAGRFKVKAILQDLNGCEYLDETFIEVRNVSGIWLPSAFSPNEDGVNDEYYIAYQDLISGSFQIQIFDRWGQLAYQSSDPAFRWDGILTAGSAAPEGVYVCRITGSYFDGAPFDETQTITLIR
ncbi:PKD domain-containing protein [Pontibacter sp. G13]|uniref:PKD domain-containing protein n=1 Tax=Pontibacter sp. G13 TaxID=3074898 RepID=UPI00288B6F4C|nr:PKD domain-containing protein [Pontibacter sp. G13]WNJ16590.1 PKD domain-containing protein [Pontibacter sp. G13]